MTFDVKTKPALYFLLSRINNLNRYQTIASIYCIYYNS
jgi:hypothetical protein